jgi:hypothetical protein
MSSALPSNSDIARRGRHFVFVPTADSNCSKGRAPASSQQRLLTTEQHSRLEDCGGSLPGAVVHRGVFFLSANKSRICMSIERRRFGGAITRPRALGELNFLSMTESRMGCERSIVTAKIKFIDLGEQSLKNIARPVRTYAVARDGGSSDVELVG